MAHTYNSAYEKKLLQDCLWQQDVEAFKAKTKPGDIIGKKKSTGIVIFQIFPFIAMTSAGPMSWLDIYQYSKGLEPNPETYGWRNIKTGYKTFARMRERWY